jgi:hypothetical protein
VYTARYPGFESLSLRHNIVLRLPVTSRRFPQTPANAGV